MRMCSAASCPEAVDRRVRALASEPGFRVVCALCPLCWQAVTQRPRRTSWLERGSWPTGQCWTLGVQPSCCVWAWGALGPALPQGCFAVFHPLGSHGRVRPEEGGLQLQSSPRTTHVALPPEQGVRGTGHAVSSWHLAPVPREPTAVAGAVGLLRLGHVVSLSCVLHGGGKRSMGVHLGGQLRPRPLAKALRPGVPAGAEGFFLMLTGTCGFHDWASVPGDPHDCGSPLSREGSCGASKAVSVLCRPPCVPTQNCGDIWGTPVPTHAGLQLWEA